MRRVEEGERSEGRLVMSRIRSDAGAVLGGYSSTRKRADVLLVLEGEKFAKTFSIEEC